MEAGFPFDDTLDSKNRLSVCAATSGIAYS